MLRSSLRDVRTITLIVLLLLPALFIACQGGARPGTPTADESVLRKLDHEWSRAVGAKDVEKTISYYADDALMMPPNIPTLTGKDSIRTLWKSLLEAPGFAGGWKATKVEVSGDLAFVTGSYEITETDESGKPMTDKGKYLKNWKKQPDGSWKCVADMFSSDMALTPLSDRVPDR
jgi:ketosteroid isomerase-like protein